MPKTKKKKETFGSEKKPLEVYIFQRCSLKIMKWKLISKQWSQPVRFVNERVFHLFFSTSYPKVNVSKRSNILGIKPVKIRKKYQIVQIIYD